MNEYCMLETANDNYEEIKSIAKELLDKKLVASCHILESESSWNWNNERRRKRILSFRLTEMFFHAIKFVSEARSPLKSKL